MATHIRRDRLEVHRGSAPATGSVPSEASAADVDDDVTGHLMGIRGGVPAPDADASPDGDPGGEPELYGVRISWQSEAVRIEAAEFLVATRVEEERRLRAARDLEVLREEHPAS